MKTIGFDDIVKKVKDACMSANFELGEDVIAAFRKTKETEESPVGKEILEQLIENAIIAKEEKIAMCQDTGFAVFFVEIGDEVKVSGGNLVEAINEGVRQGYKEGYLRKSICHPFTRKNTGDNTPAIVHLDMVPGDQLKIIVAPKGGGS
ncbi:MAG: fumarate hydratase, partial [Deltaproteobacteria bacterium]|nr:fumarate hydratase [Deltaproteobacteria bacterium]